MGIVKYKYALNGNGEKVAISEVTPEIRKGTKFKCVSCGNELSACLGTTNQHHFRHKTQVDCNLETYLHKMGKYVFIKTYEDCLAQRKPFSITINRRISCIKDTNCPIKPLYGNSRGSCWDCKSETFDLTKYYDLIYEEQQLALLSQMSY